VEKVLSRHRLEGGFSEEGKVAASYLELGRTYGTPRLVRNFECLSKGKRGWKGLGRSVVRRLAGEGKEKRAGGGERKFCQKVLIGIGLQATLTLGNRDLLLRLSHHRVRWFREEDSGTQEEEGRATSSSGSPSPGYAFDVNRLRRRND